MAVSKFSKTGRKARNPSLHAFLACLLVLQFNRLNSWKNAILFPVLGILLFHTHPIGVAAVGMLCGLTLVYRRFRDFRTRCCWAAAADEDRK